MMNNRESIDLDFNPWSIKVDRFLPEKQRLIETLFAQANGYIGIRGGFEEGLPDDIGTQNSVLLNGVYQRHPIVYGEKAYGYATHNQQILAVPDARGIQLSLDGETLSVCNHSIACQQELDFRDGVLTSVQSWQLPSGKKLKLIGRRFVSLANPNLLAIEYQLIAENFSGALELTSTLDAERHFSREQNTDDPRVGEISVSENLQWLTTQQQEKRNAFLHKVRDTDFVIAVCALDALPTNAVHLSMENIRDKKLLQHYQINLVENKATYFYKWIAYDHVDLKDKPGTTLLSGVQAITQTACDNGFDKESAAHRQRLEHFWHTADINIEGDERLQQGIRFNMFHVFQSTARNSYANIAAKGLTGHGYDGHYFWDTEIYVLPFLCFTQPKLARTLLEFRIRTLPQARERAGQMSHTSGALYPWRTIGGEECSAYYPAGTAQYHINAAIAYALKQYLNASGDENLLWNGGFAMLVETARLWPQLGHFNAQRKGAFCIDAVTGPDEYTAVVNNNFYTNAMAQMHLYFAVDTAAHLKHQLPEGYEILAIKLGLTEQEIAQWKNIADNMYLPYDETHGIHLQDDSFLHKKAWDFAGTPRDKYPLLLHYHPLVIYRHQVLKQADVVLAMYLLDDRFDIAQKKRNLAFYEPLTTHDSTLSSCIHSIESCETGDYKKAYQFFEDSVRMDLDNHHANTEYGVHIACMAGSWASMVHGFGGFRARADGLHFRPYLPSQWRSYSFRLCYRKQVLKVTVSTEGVRYQLLEGQALNLYHFQHTFGLSPQQAEKVFKWSLSSEHSYLKEKEYL